MPGVTVNGFSNFYNPVKFSVYRSAAQNTGNGAFALLACDTKLFDTSTNVDVVTNKGRFTAPVAGFYLFTVSAYANNGSSANHQCSVALYKNGAVASQGGTAPSWNGVAMASHSDVLQLVAGDYVEGYVYANTTLTLVTSTASANHFSGFLISLT